MIIVICKNSTECTIGEYDEQYFLEDLITPDITLDKFISRVQNLIVNINKKCNDDTSLIINGNQGLLNIMLVVANLPDRKINHGEWSDKFHDVVMKQSELLGGIINNFNGNVQVVKIKRDYKGNMINNDQV